MRTRVLTVRYVGALVVVAGLLVAGQTVIHQVLTRQEGDARVVNLAGRQRMLGQRLCTLVMALDIDPAVIDPARDLRGELRDTADAWEANQIALRAGRPEAGLRGNSPIVGRLFEGIDADHRAMLAAARAAIARPAGTLDVAEARAACAHQEAFLDGMDRIVTQYEHEARQRIVGLRRLELVLLGFALLVLVLDGAFVFRPAVRQLRLRLTERDVVLHEIARLEQQALQIGDREQARLAQDLHDGLGQQLIGASFLLRPLRQQLDGAVAAQLGEIETLIGAAIEQTRDLVRGLHPTTLEVAGLAAALDEVAAHVARVFGVDCRVCDRAGGELPEASRAQLYRIAREAVINAAKHARATRIDIELELDAGELVLAVRDDGIGIPARPAIGMGLHLMAHRARLIGAALDVAAGPVRGTTVTCRVALGALGPGAAP